MTGHVGDSDIDRDAEELHASRDDPDEWDDETAEVHVRPMTTSVVSFRMPHDDLNRLQSISRARGESISDFVRDSIRVRIGHLSDAGAADSGVRFAAAADTPELEAIARIDGVEPAHTTGALSVPSGGATPRSRYDSVRSRQSSICWPSECPSPLA